MKSAMIGLLGGIAAVAICGAVYRALPRRPDIAPLEHAVAAAKVERAAAAETVTVYVPIAAAAKAQSDASDKPVGIVDTTTLEVHLPGISAPARVTVPALVVTDLSDLRRTVAAQARAIGALEDQIHADSLVIRRQDSLIVAMRPPRCGAKCGGGITAVVLLGLRLIAR